MYLRDHGPSFMKVFVSRGRSEVERGQSTVNEQIDNARAMGEATVESNGAPILRLVSEGLATLRERAEEALHTLGVFSDEAGAEPEVTEPAATEPANDHTSWSASSAASAGTGDLAIADYDNLSASQIVDRLDGLGRDDLETIRAYETAHRARNTILGKLEQLTRGT
jgi:hypothetical protein